MTVEQIWSTPRDDWNQTARYKDCECLMCSCRNALRRHRPSLALEMDWGYGTCDGIGQSGWWQSPTNDLGQHSIAKKNVQWSKRWEEGTASTRHTIDLPTRLNVVCLNKLFPRYMVHGYLNPVARNLYTKTVRLLIQMIWSSKVQGIDNLLRQMPNQLQWRTHAWLLPKSHTWHHHC